MNANEMLSRKMVDEKAETLKIAIRFCEKMLLVYGNRLLEMSKHDLRYFIYNSKILREAGYEVYPKSSVRIGSCVNI